MLGTASALDAGKGLQRVDARYIFAGVEAEIFIAHERRTFDIAVFRVASLDRLRYLPGQSVAVESPLRPRVWRFYSIANAPREDATLDFHVRMIDGGALSMALLSGLTPGARLRLGPPVGRLTLDTTTGRDVLLVAGSTGLAPLKAGKNE